MRFQTLLLGLLAIGLTSTVVSAAPQSTGKGGTGKSATGKTDATSKAPRRMPPLPIPKVLVLHRAGRKITIDGGLGDWPKQVMAIELKDARQVSGTALGAYRGVKDVSGQVYMVWDEDFLYVSAHIFDDWHRPLARGTMNQEIPPVDSLVLTFDPARDTNGFGRDPGRREDRRFVLAQMEQLGDKILRWNWMTATRDKTRGGVLKIDRQDKQGLTTIEAKIPWSEILRPDEKAVDRKVIDLQVVINDYDEVTDSLPQTRVGWNFGMGSTIRQGLYGSIMLIADQRTVGENMPTFPRPAQAAARVTRLQWIKLNEKLLKTKPAFVTRDTPDPAMVGGAERFELLSELDGYIERFPRLDHLEFASCIQRRMNRECAGMSDEGVPFYWRQATRSLRAAAEKLPPDGITRIFRMPQGGWLVRSKEASFMIDPSGFGIESFFMEGMVDFVILTRPTQVTRRHEQMLIRMASAKPQRSWFTHLNFHLTGSRPGSMHVVTPFQDYPVLSSLKRVVPIGKKTDEGKVTVSMGYLIEWKDGRTLMTSGLSITKKEVDRLGVKPDVLIVPGLHPQSEDIAKAIAPKQVIVEDVLMAEERPDYFGGRFSLEAALKLQANLRPLPSVIIAPAESIDFGKAK